MIFRITLEQKTTHEIAMELDPNSTDTPEKQAEDYFSSLTPDEVQQTEVSADGTLWMAQAEVIG
jgi:hypothetical protein